MTSTFAARLRFENNGTHRPQDTHGRKCVPCVPLCSGDTHGTRPGRVLAGRAGRVAGRAGRVAGRAGAGRAGRVLAHTAHGPGAARPARPWCCAASAACARRPAASASGQRPAAPRPGWQGRAVRATATERSQTIFIFMI